MTTATTTTTNRRRRVRRQRSSVSIRPASLFEEETSCDFDRECLNGGRCEVEIGLHSDSSRCVCDPAYAGRRCEVPVPPGVVAPPDAEEDDDDDDDDDEGGCGSDEDCKNGGRCDLGRQSGGGEPSLAGRCECPATHYGSRCEDACPCMNGGTCLSSSSGTGLYRCQCPDGFVDALCATRLDGYTLPGDDRGAWLDVRSSSGVLLFFFLVLGIATVAVAAARRSRRRRKRRGLVGTDKNEEGWNSGMVGEVGNPSVERAPGGGGGIVYRDGKLGGGGGSEVEEGLPIRENPSMDDDTLPTNLSDLEPTFT